MRLLQSKAGRAENRLSEVLSVSLRRRRFVWGKFLSELRMKLSDINNLNIGPRLTLTFAVLVAMILGGNGFLVWQFHLVRLQSEHVTGVSQQLIAVLRLQQSLFSFHEELDEVAQSKDARLLVSEGESLRRALLEQTQRTRTVLASLPAETRVDSAFLPTLDVIEFALPSQLQEITALATSGDWEAVRLRLANELKPLESQTSALVNSIDQEVSAEMTQAVTNMTAVQRRVLLVVPATAILTFFIAAFFGWTITRRILELRLEERVNERTRIARELHDTLLQGLFTVSMLLQDAVEQLPADSPAKRSFARVVQLTGQVVEEGRNAVRGFRSTDRETQDLERAFSRIPQEVDVTEQVDFRVIVEGQPQSLHPAIRDDIYSIGREALVNSFRHSGASKIEVELKYSASQLRVLVRDDGCGIDPKVLQSGRDGHWGLLGMRERAKGIGAKVKVLSRAGGGTEVDLRVPSHIAFESRSSTPAPDRITGSG
jgi:signal transduction histidine kinase